MTMMNDDDDDSLFCCSQIQLSLYQALKY